MQCVIKQSVKVLLFGFEKKITSKIPSMKQADSCLCLFISESLTFKVYFAAWETALEWTMSSDCFRLISAVVFAPLFSCSIETLGSQLFNYALTGFSHFFIQQFTNRNLSKYFSSSASSITPPNARSFQLRVLPKIYRTLNCEIIQSCICWWCLFDVKGEFSRMHFLFSIFRMNNKPARCTLIKYHRYRNLIKFFSISQKNLQLHIFCVDERENSIAQNKLHLLLWFQLLGKNIFCISEGVRV